MTSPHANQEFAPRKIGVAAVCVRDGKLLVIRRSQQVRSPGRYCFPGGSIEPGEAEEVALLREMQEELGVAVRAIRLLHRSVTPWRVALRWWMAELPGDELVPAPAEVESIHWLTVAEMLALEALLDSNRDFIAAWQRGEFEIDGLKRS